MNSTTQVEAHEQNIQLSRQNGWYEISTKLLPNFADLKTKCSWLQIRRNFALFINRFKSTGYNHSTQFPKRLQTNTCAVRALRRGVEALTAT